MNKIRDPYWGSDRREQNRIQLVSQSWCAMFVCVSCIMCVFSWVFVLDLTAPSSILYHLSSHCVRQEIPGNHKRQQQFSRKNIFLFKILSRFSFQVTILNNTPSNTITMKVFFLFRIFIISKKSFKCYKHIILQDSLTDICRLCLGKYV